MTDDTMNPQALVGKSADADFLRAMIGFAAQRLMELEVGSLTGAGYGEKSSGRLAQRNGCRERDWETRAGTVELRIPRLRTGRYFPAFLEPRRLAEKALTAVVQEAYIQGIPGAPQGLSYGQRQSEQMVNKSLSVAAKYIKFRGFVRLDELEVTGSPLVMFHPRSS